jgi:asparagine synthase (glutamine-hydrolysing)
MCGIAGTVDLHPGLGSAEELVARMTDLLAHRGPDDAGLLVDPPVVLGNRRLSILDLSSAGHQPMGSEDGRAWVTYNGEIYNYKELGQELRARGHRFDSSGDTEVLLRAYLEWGPDCLARLNGMFAFAVWDRRRGDLFCARDRFGVKPFYYTVAGGRFRLASEIKALLLDPEVPRRPNDPRVFDFLARGLADHTEETMFEGIYQLPPGSCLWVSPTEGVGRPRAWYRLEPAGLDGRPASETVRELLTDAVSLRLRSDVPVGTMLSGGLDSSSVTTLASRLRMAEGVPPPESFTSGCRDPRIDEGRYVQGVLGLTGSRNHKLLPDDRSLLGELDDVLWHMDEPFHTAGIYAHWKLTELARDRGITVILDGEGGDEAFLGYHFLLYPAVYFSLARRGRLINVAKELYWRRRRNGVSLRSSAEEALRVALPKRLRAQRRPAWINKELPIPPRPLPSRTVRDYQLHGLTVSPLPMHNHQGDRNSMRFSVEARNPFLDYRIVELGLGLPPRDLLHQGRSKWVVREAMRDVLPQMIVDRSDKQGFTTDEAEWIRRGKLSSEIESVFRSKSFAARPYFQPNALSTMLEAHRAGQEFGFTLWRAFMVERWLRLFIDPAQFQPVATRLPAVRARDNVTRLEEERPTTSAGAR